MSARRVAIATAVLAACGLAAAQASQTPQPWRDPSSHQTRWVTVDSSVRLEVLDWGGSGPPLVLLGCYLTAHSYDEFAPKLTNQFHVYGITRRGIGDSDKPVDGYSVQRSVDDLREALDVLQLDRSLLLGTSCAGRVQTMFASQHPQRLIGLIYLDGASDPLTTADEYSPSMPDFSTLPREAEPLSALDKSSFDAYRRATLRSRGFAFPEAELRQVYVANPDGSIGASRLSPVIRQAITVDSRVRPDYSRIRAPVLAIYQAQRSFEDLAARYIVRTDQERAALRQMYDATRAVYALWQRQLRAAVPTARIVDLPGANVYMFLTHDAEVLREVRAFSAAAAGK